jgi:UDP-glucose 4-epimerase
LVTGGAGFIGSHLIGALLAEGHEVAALDDLSVGRRERIPPAVRLDVVDVADAAAVAASVAAFRPEVITHHAAQPSVPASLRDPAFDARVNIHGTLNVAEAAARVGARVIYAGTGGAVYGEVPTGAATEQTLPQPATPYGASKLAGEHYLRAWSAQHGTPTVILRYANVYGPDQDPHGEAGVVAIFATRALAGGVLGVFGQARLGDGGGVRDYTYVGDVIRANLAALRGTLDGRTLNIATGIGTCTRDLATAIVRLAGAGSIVDLPPRPGDVARSVLDGSAAHAILGAPTPLEEGLARTIEWFHR